MKIGIVFGCFIPLHKGHLSLINKAINENPKVIIGVCGSDNDRGKNFLPFKTRLELMKTKYKDNPNIIVVPVDDEKLGLTGKFDLESWEIWCDELFTNANINPHKNKCVWYTGEMSYSCKICQLYPNHLYLIADRSEINISGTMIRKNPNKYKEYIDKDFYNYLKGTKIYRGE